jgi:hypothetical protein
MIIIMVIVFLIIPMFAIHNNETDKITAKTLIEQSKTGITTNRSIWITKVQELYSNFTSNEISTDTFINQLNEINHVHGNLKTYNSSVWSAGEYIQTITPKNLSNGTVKNSIPSI